jgi:hypothetical protein
MDPQQQWFQALLQQLTDQQALLQQQAQQLTALQQQVAQQQQQPTPAAPVFALTPALAQTRVINYSDTAGIKLRKSIISPLVTPFDGTPTKLMQFLDDVKQRASSSGWETVLLTISNQATPAVNYNLIASHRMLTIENVRAHAMVYSGQQTRLAQDSFMMFEFLRDLLTDSARSRVSVEASKYVVNGIEDGPCYLKVILMKFHVETNVTNFHLRQSLLRLPTTIVDLKSDVPSFNHYVQDIVKDLAAGGETSTDLLVYLFLAYAAVEDKEFKDFIKRRKQDYDDGKEVITVEALMDQALNKYNQLVQDGTWKAKTPEEQQLIALTAQLKEAKSKIAELAKGKSNSKPSSDKKKENSSSSTNEKSGGSANGKDSPRKRSSERGVT